MRRTPGLLMPNLPGNQARDIEVRALAAKRLPRAALSIRSTLAAVSPARATLLNTVFSSMLGGTISLDAVGYTGLVNGRLQMLGFLDQLALDLGIAAGHHDQVLDTSVTVGTLAQAAVRALQRQGDTAQATITALDAFRVAANVPGAQPLVKLGHLLDVQTGAEAAALAVDLPLFQLAEGLVHLANGANALSANVPLSVPGLINVTATMKVIEPPQISAVGDPALAKLEPLGTNGIAVRTAQVRTLLTVELPLLTVITKLIDTLKDALAGLLDTLNSLLSLNLGNVLACAVVCTNQEIQDSVYLSPNVRIDISVDAGGGASHVTDFSCTNGVKSLSAQTSTSIANVRIGKMGTTLADAKAQVLGKKLPPVVEPLPLLDVGSKTCTKVLLGIITTCGARKPFFGGGLALKGEIPIAGTSNAQVFVDPPDVGNPPAYQAALPAQDIVKSLDTTLKAASTLLQPIAPKKADGTTNSAAPGVLAGIFSALAGVISALGTVVSGSLAPLLDPLINTLLRDVLGLSLAQTEVGAQLSCTQGAELVF